MNFHPIENSSATAKQYVPLLMNWYRPVSVLDLGCNVGWWLYWFKMYGTKHITGIDGENMRQFLKISPHQFMAADLTKPINLNARFDLLLCLEVAEHLPEKSADHLVNICAAHSNTIFWSAATPGQGGYNHLNEQPVEYWIEKFAAHGFKHRLLADVLPPAPHDYYRKNAIEFKK